MCDVQYGDVQHRPPPGGPDNTTVPAVACSTKCCSLLVRRANCFLRPLTFPSEGLPSSKASKAAASCRKQGELHWQLTTAKMLHCKQKPCRKKVSACDSRLCTCLKRSLSTFKIQTKGVVGATHAAYHEQRMIEACRAYLGIPLCLSLCS